MTWDEQYKQGQGRYFPNEEVVRYLGRTYGPVTYTKAAGYTAIEIGCGVGGNIRALSEWGFFTYGLEMSQEAIKLGTEYAKHHRYDYSKEFRQYKAPAAIHLPARCANLVLDIQTLQHLDEYAHVTMYKEIHRLLVTGGTFFSVHWCGDFVDAQAIFPAHPELSTWAEGYVSIPELILEAGFSIESRELVGRTYHSGTKMARWIAIEARKI